MDEEEKKTERKRVGISSEQISFFRGQEEKNRYEQSLSLSGRGNTQWSNFLARGMSREFSVSILTFRREMITPRRFRRNRLCRGELGARGEISTSAIHLFMKTSPGAEKWDGRSKRVLFCSVRVLGAGRKRGFFLLGVFLSVSSLKLSKKNRHPFSRLKIIFKMRIHHFLYPINPPSLPKTCNHV